MVENGSGVSETDESLNSEGFPFFNEEKLKAAVALGLAGSKFIHNSSDSNRKFLISALVEVDRIGALPRRPVLECILRLMSEERK